MALDELRESFEEAFAVDELAALIVLRAYLRGEIGLAEAIGRLRKTAKLRTVRHESCPRLAGQ